MARKKSMRDLTVEQQLARGPLDLPFLMLVVMLVMLPVVMIPRLSPGPRQALCD